MAETNRWKVVISEQMFHYVQPIVVISRVVGLSPVKYQKIGQHYILSISYLYVAYSYLFGIILAVSAITGLVRDLKATPEYSLRIKDTKGSYVVHLRLPASDKKNQRRSSFVISLVSYFIFISVLTYDFIGWVIQTRGKPSSINLWHNIPVYILYVVSWTQEICYWHMTYFVKLCVMAFNEDLSLYVQVKEKLPNVKLSSNNSVVPGEGIKHSVFSLDNMGRNSEGNFLKRNVLTTDKAKILIHVHRILFGAVNLINEWYGLPLLLILLSCFLQLIGTPYFMLSNTSEKAMVFSILEVVWLFTHTSRLLIIVEASYRCVIEYDKINYLLCQHLENDYDYGTMHKLKVLALQINTCKVKFSTCGIANINRSILASITGAVTTYLVILVQLNDNSIPVIATQTTESPH
ncbi:gustatory receptor for sugar taste 43a-like isoform X3 [Harmonia axyridis]|uniref:gustatory receptor for sugar taste 43a-like isoform X3 n=1 Tax=Harmonia axyridis TaxID=115357 RepID=UPI001E27521D|nr:gustatory receptor for sugar taste 43a-like isoform X3 [Harmonia axyridis]